MSPRVKTAALVAAPGLLAALSGTRDTLVWLLIVGLACAGALRLVGALAATPAPRSSGREVALLALVACSLLGVVAWGGRLPLQLEPLQKLPAHLIASAVAAGCAWALLAPSGGVPTPEPSSPGGDA